MKLFVIFGVIAAFLFLLFLYLLDLILFCFFEKRAFDQKGDTREYLQRIQEKHKKTKQRRKRNFLLFLISLSFEKQGEERKMQELLPFIKKDALLGIHKKEADH